MTMNLRKKIKKAQRALRGVKAAIGQLKQLDDGQQLDPGKAWTICPTDPLVGQIYEALETLDREHGQLSNLLEEQRRTAEQVLQSAEKAFDHASAQAAHGRQSVTAPADTQVQIMLDAEREARRLVREIAQMAVDRAQVAYMASLRAIEAIKRQTRSLHVLIP